MDREGAKDYLTPISIKANSGQTKSSKSNQAAIPLETNSKASPKPLVDTPSETSSRATSFKPSARPSRVRRVKKLLVKGRENK